jgi:lysophospholipase L1-like esterase
MRAIVLVLSASLLASGCSKSPTNPTQPPASNVVNYSALGASDAIGFGSSSVCLPFVACPDGKGYVQVLTRRFRSDGRTVTLLNLGLPGSVLSPEIQSIGNQIGRNILTNFLDNQVSFVASDATLVTVFAGANDANVLGGALEAGLGGADPLGYLLTRVQNFGRDLERLVDSIRGRASQARIVFLNLPNLAGLPYASGYTLQERRALQEIAVRLSAEVNRMTARGASIVDVMCDASFYQASMYSGDGFHPNDAGYQRMADVTYPAATGAVPPPQSSCSFMRLF